MIRSLFVSLFFFFGPALLLFMLRNLALLLVKTKNRHEKAQQPEVIDITPVDKERAPNWFYVLVVAISLSIAITVFFQMQKQDGVEEHHYVPAHIGGSGHIVTGDWKPSDTSKAP